jgi:streptomycin 6-kinase
MEEWRHEPEWLAALPDLVSDCAARWSLVPEEPIETPHSFVVPAGEAILKLNAPSHYEADHEADALACWAGDGAVRLLARDDSRRALLVERCRPGVRLSASDADETAVVAALISRLSRTPVASPFRHLADEADRWAEEAPARYRAAGQPFERLLLEYALDVYRTVDRGARFLVNQDLHGENVLSAEREPWLVIDPKPLVGERELDAVGLLRGGAWNDDRPGLAVRRWLDVLAELGFDRDRARGWGVAHALAWAWEDDAACSALGLAAARTILAA